MATKLKVVSEYSDKGLKRAKSDIGAFGRYTSGVFKQVGGVIAGVFAVRSIINFVKTSIGAYFRQEKAVESLRQAILASSEAQDILNDKTKGFSEARKFADDYTSRLQKAASALQVLTRVGDEAIMEIMAQGAQMGVAAENLDEYATAVLMVSKTTKQGLREIAKQVKDQFAGQTNELTKLVPGLEKATTAQDRYNAIMAFANDRMREQTELSLTNAERALAVQAAWSDLTEQIGAFFIESGLAQNVMDELLFAIEDIQAVGFGAWFEETFPALDGFIDRLVGILEALGMLDEKINTRRDMEVNLTGTRMGVGLTEAEVARGVGRPPEQRTRQQIKASMTELERRRSTRDAERQARREEREARKAQRLEEARAILEAMRSTFTRRPPPPPPTATTTTTGGQALSAGDLFERAFGATVAAANGTRQNPYFVILNNPEDINTGLAE